ncbi:non-heme iron oxygenase ferredoxin subunit [Streptomyces sp. CA-249302]|uniref:non-heme iron oxygenase ferredoxin subunit n=1 Tax=Streptomyces sp. CA-249302 TaxID=3240058 RepID=UPI003D8A1755
MGRADEMAEGDVRVLDAPPGPRLAVFRAECAFYAVDDRCSRQQAWLSDGWVEDCFVECPLHAGRFDLRTGKPNGPPATAPLTTYPTSVIDGVVDVAVLV